MARTGRIALVLGTAALLAVGAVALGAWAVTGLGPAAPVTLDAALAALAAGGAAAVLAWWSVGLAACVVSAGLVPGRARPRTRSSVVAGSLARSLPGPVRALAAAALGVAVATGTAVSATAGPVPAAVSVPDPGWSATPPASLPAPAPAPLEAAPAGFEPAAVDPGWAPHRPAEPRRSPLAELVVDQPRAAAVVADELVVRRGDTLWDICARHLPPDATDAEIAAEWPRWYEANRTVIGPDPDHIEPGQRLRPPGSPQTTPTT